MFLVNLISFLFLAVGVIFSKTYLPAFNQKEATADKQVIRFPLKVGLLLAVAFFLRTLLAAFEYGHPQDLSCFAAWSDGAYARGLTDFYKDDFCSYTPGFAYIFWILGFFRAQFPVLTATSLFLKLPAIICDLITGLIICRQAKKRFTENAAILLGAFYLFQPFILIDSAGWGQVDSVYTLFLFLSIVCLCEEKRGRAYFFFAIGCLMKLQTIVLFPVLFAAIIDQVFLHDFSFKKMWKDLFLGIGSLLMMYLLVLPFQFDNSGLGVVDMSGDVLSSFEYVTVNAYNFWEIFALNWHSQEETFLGITYASWGTFFIVLMTLMTLYLILRRYKEKRPERYVLAGAFLSCAFFTMSARIHERYMFPVFALLLMAYILRPRREYLYVFFGLTVSQTNNIWHVLKFYDAYNFDWEAKFPRIIALWSFLCFLYLTEIAIKALAARNALPDDTPSEKSFRSPSVAFTTGIRPAKSAQPVRLNRIDLICILLITGLYAAVALSNIGDRQAPSESYDMYYPDEFVLDFQNQQLPSCVYFFNGQIDNRTYLIEQSEDGSTWIPVGINYEDANVISMGFPFCWSYALLDLKMPYLRFTCQLDEASIGELVFMEPDGTICLPNNAEDYEELFDEQDIFPGEDTYMSSTYFDEIYHARTAYEMTEGLYNYEWTHPPLGKIIISIGIRIFGMCPFGWRIMGVLFGIFMLPPFYYLAKLFVRETYFAALTTTLLAADFMHFTQTRIATIDVYVTFFIILMYLFMFAYCRTSFYDTPHKKSWPVLLACGISMGLGCACKWTGFYAAAGLAVLFFLTLGRRYLEYLYAKKDPDGSTDGLSHREIVNGFAPEAIKTCCFCVLAFVIVPLIIYTLSYIPFSDGSSDGMITQMIRNQRAIWIYHSTLDATHPFSSVWYEWILDKRPVLYYSKTLSNGLRGCISAMGNPIIWWLGIAAFLFMIFLVICKKDIPALGLSIGYLAQLLPWTMVTRCTFAYHYFPSVPFLIVMIGYGFYRILGLLAAKNKLRITVRTVFALYAAAAVALFILFYPVLSGRPVSQEYIDDHLLWVESWQLY